jgi:hypothetical protein
MAGKGQLRRGMCRCKMRMSGLCKVEMSAFIGGRGPHGNGANLLEPTRTGPVAGATRSEAEADHAGGSCQAAEDERSPDPSAAVWFRGTRRSSSDPWITRESIKPQVSRGVGARDFAPGAATLCGRRANSRRRAAQEGLPVSRETLRKWMVKASLWRPRAQRVRPSMCGGSGEPVSESW